MTILHNLDREEMKQPFTPTQSHNHRLQEEGPTVPTCNEVWMSCCIQPTYTSHATHVLVVEWFNVCTGIFCQFVEGLS